MSRLTPEAEERIRACLAKPAGRSSAMTPALKPFSDARHLLDEVDALRARIAQLEMAGHLLCTAAMVGPDSFVCPKAFAPAVRAMALALGLQVKP